MERISLPGTDLEVSPVCYGTAALDVRQTDPSPAELLDAYRKAGGNFIDTAHCYSFWRPGGNGASESAVGRYVEHSGAGDLVVATKGGHPGAPGYRKVERWLSPHRIRADVDDSLGRLGLDAIDLYYLHRDDLEADVGEVMETLNEEIRRGRIRYLGASNWTCRRIRAANRYAEEHGLRGFVVSQVQWSLAHREPPEPEPRGTQIVYAGEEEVSFHAETGIPIAAFSSTGKGFFAADAEKPDAFDNPTSRGRLRRARELAERKGVTPTQVALAWLMHQDFPVFPITGTQNPEHLRENMAAADLDLTAGEVDWLAEG